LNTSTTGTNQVKIGYYWLWLDVITKKVNASGAKDLLQGNRMTAVCSAMNTLLQVI